MGCKWHSQATTKNSGLLITHKSQGNASYNMELQITKNTPQMPNTPTKTFISGLAKGGLMFGPWKKRVANSWHPQNWDPDFGTVQVLILPLLGPHWYQNLIFWPTRTLMREPKKSYHNGSFWSIVFQMPPKKKQDLNQPTPPLKKKRWARFTRIPGAFSRSLQKPTKIRHGDTGGRGEIRHFDEILNQGSHQKSKKCHEDTHQNTCLSICFCCFFLKKVE